MSKDNIQKYVIYQVNQIHNTNLAKLKQTGYILSTDELYDQQLPINFNQHKNASTYPINDEVFIKFFKCNNTSFFIMKNTKLPIYSASLYYQKKFITGYLMTIFLYFVIKSDLNNIKSFEQLLNTELDGQYILEVEIDDKVIYTQNIDSISNDDNVFSIFMNFISNNNSLIHDEMKKRDIERKNKYGQFINYDIQKPVLNYNHMLNAYKNGNNIDEFLDKL